MTERTLFFEPFSGASGDMIIAALIDLGADAAQIRKNAERCAAVSFKTSRVNKAGISATDIDFVELSENNERHYDEICDAVRAAGLDPEIEADALAVFEYIAKAEAAVHNTDLSHLHFHETGQDDAIADVVGACTAFYDLFSRTETAFDAVCCLPVNVGGGTVVCRHGELPVPAPATLEILKAGKLPFYSRGHRELLTPTGAALLAHFTRKYPCADTERAAVAVRIGYGAGKADLSSPNVLRVSLLERETSGFIEDHVDILETNVDDVTGEVIGALIDGLMKAGARDVSVIPVTMKKGRPGHMIRVVSTSDDSGRLAAQIIRETGTLGVRIIPTVRRLTVIRDICPVDVVFGSVSRSVPIKIARLSDGAVIRVSAEYEDCRKIADELDLPLKEVIRKAECEACRKFEVKDL